MSATYVRTHLSRVKSIQRWVAVAARTGELVDEEELWSDFAVFLMKHGSGTEEAVDQIVQLAKVLANARAKITATSAADAGASEGLSDALVVSATADEDEVVPSPLTPVYSVPDDKPAMGDFIVSLRRGFRRLHRTGDCHLVPGVDYKDFRVLGSSRPSCEHYDAACKFCFKLDDALAMESSSGDTSSSNS